MREPTEAMLKAIPHIDCSDQSYVGEDQIEQGCRAMIDKALK